MLFPDPSQRVYGHCHRYVVSMALPSKKHFRTINVQSIGNGAFLAVVAVPRISNLRAVKAPDSSTPVASTGISFIINCLRGPCDWHLAALLKLSEIKCFS